MTGARCLQWCMEYRGKWPDDFVTAGHVVEWLADKAREWASCDEHFYAIEEALAWACAYTQHAAFSTIEQFARYYGPAWVKHAATRSILGYRFSISRGRPARPPYSDWPAIVRYAHGASNNGGYVDNEWLQAMAWYADARLVLPDYAVAHSSTDPRLRELAGRDTGRCGHVFAPLLPWHTLDCAPIGGRWDAARWVRLLHDNGGPYSPVLL